MSFAHKVTPFLIGFFFLSQSVVLQAQEASPPTVKPVANTIFKKEFFLDPTERGRLSATPAENFLLIPHAAPDWDSSVSIVTDFSGRGIRSQILKNIRSINEAKEWIRKEKKTHTFEGVQIHELPIALRNGKIQKRFWVGNKSFTSLNGAISAIASTQKKIEMGGGNFLQAVEMTKVLAQPDPSMQTGAEIIKNEAQFLKEEEIMLRWLDQLNIGDELFGPFQGTSAGKGGKILYQSFGETSWRATNMAERKFRSQVGFWTHRLVFQGIRFPLSTLDPYVELTGALESSPNDGGSHLDTSIGVEWRPFKNNPWFDNYHLWDMPLLVWAKNYRFFAQYFNRRNLKEEIAFIRDEDFRIGFGIFYEWGIGLPSLDREIRNDSFVDVLRNYVWGEYFGEYAWRHSNFTTEENFDAWILDTSIILGLKTPGIKLPPNPINEQFVLMPYFRFVLTSNTQLSNPFDNKYYVSVGVRWMPFRDYRFQNNEWLFKTKLFAEWLAIGKIQHLKQDQDKRPLPDEDWRIGVSFSLHQF